MPALCPRLHSLASLAHFKERHEFSVFSWWGIFCFVFSCLWISSTCFIFLPLSKETQVRSAAHWKLPEGVNVLVCLSVHPVTERWPGPGWTACPSVWVHSSFPQPCTALNQNKGCIIDFVASVWCQHIVHIQRRTPDFLIAQP